MVDRGQQAGVPIEDWNAEEWQLTRCDLASPIGFERLEKYPSQGRSVAAEFIENRHAADETREPAGASRVQAQKADNVARICVVVLALAGLIDTHAWVLAGQSLITHVTQQVPPGVLRAEIPEMQAQAEKRH